MAHQWWMAQFADAFMWHGASVNFFLQILEIIIGFVYEAPQIFFWLHLLFEYVRTENGKYDKNIATVQIWLPYEHGVF